MIKNIVALIICLICSSCSFLGETEEVKSSKNLAVIVINDSIPEASIKTLRELKLETDLDKSYTAIKKEVQEEKLQNKALPGDSLSNLFKISLVNRIIPFWEGTAWSFEGHTAVPNKGEIACGYFVSTTLKHVGVNINRYKLAQQSPINEAASLALTSNVLQIQEESTKENISKINDSLMDGIHFIGFDSSHVGYILKENGHLYLIHSNYIDAKGVEIEEIEKSDVFASFHNFYIVELSTNQNFLQKWITGSPINVIRS